MRTQSRRSWVVIVSVVGALGVGAGLRLLHRPARLPPVETAAPLSGPELGRRAYGLAAEARRRGGDPALYQEAAVIAYQALLADPENLDAQRTHLLALQDQHAFRELAVAAGRLEAKHPGDPFFPLLRGDALVERGEYDAAAEAYQRVMDLSASSAAFERAGYLRYLTGDVDGAEALYQEAARRAGHDDSGGLAWALTDLGELYLLQGDAARARPYFETALQWSPRDARAALDRGHALRGEGRREEALAAYDAALAIRDVPQTRRFRAELLEEMERPKEAAAERATVLAQAGEDRRLKLVLLLEDVERSAPALAEAVQLAREEYALREDVFTAGQLSLALHHAGLRDEARALSQKAQRYRTLDAHLAYQGAVIAEEAGEAAAAKDAYARALRALPPLPQSLRRQAQARLAALSAR